MRYLRFVFLYTLLYIGGMAHAFPADSVEVSLLTCSPGTEVYSLYGHTAIRVKSYTTGEDWVFNYGVFSLLLQPSEFYMALYARRVRLSNWSLAFCLLCRGI